MSHEYSKTNEELTQIIAELRAHVGDLELHIKEKERVERELRDSERSSRAWLDNSPMCTKIVDRDFNLRYMSCAGVRDLGLDDITPYYGKPYPLDFYPEEFSEAMTACMREALLTGRVGTLDSSIVDVHGNVLWFHSVLVPVNDDEGEVDYLMIVSTNTTERVMAERDKERIEAQLSEARKLEALGTMAAGLAHEINTPAQFIGANTQFLQTTFGELTPLLQTAEQLAESVCGGGDSIHLAEELRSAMSMVDVSFLTGEVPRAIDESLHGVEMVRKIAWSMNAFSSDGNMDKIEVDLNRVVESSVTVAANEWRYVADMEMDLDPELPLVRCLQGGFSQVILNLVVNAAHAIADKVRETDTEKGTIKIQTKRIGEMVEIRVTDSGTGIPEDARGRIFDPFFTTKSLGKGLGQGLSLAHSVVVREHGGSLTFETVVGEGTTFTIRLPIEEKSGLEAHYN
ncbi:MAG: PAS domain-containing protein [Planctomycetes bacterium]|nr:PAS domain-containing protein [Planctomycetota bacterium]